MHCTVSGVRMEKLANSLLLKDFIDILTTDINGVSNDMFFSCRPLKGATAEQDTVLGRFRGKIGLADATEFQKALDDMVNDRRVKIILDFADVTLSRSALGILVSFAARIYGRNKHLYLYRPSEQILASMESLGVSGFFTFLKTEEDILLTLVV